MERDPIRRVSGAVAHYPFLGWHSATLRGLPQNPPVRKESPYWTLSPPSLVGHLLGVYTLVSPQGDHGGLKHSDLSQLGSYQQHPGRSPKEQPHSSARPRHWHSLTREWGRMQAYLTWDLRWTESGLLTLARQLIHSPDQYWVKFLALPNQQACSSNWEMSWHHNTQTVEPSQWLCPPVKTD